MMGVKSQVIGYCLHLKHMIWRMVCFMTRFQDVGTAPVYNFLNVICYNTHITK